MFSKLLKKYNQPVLVLMMALALGLVGCGGGGGGTPPATDPPPPPPVPTLSGTAAAGAAIIGQVIVKGSANKTKTAEIEANGHYDVDVSGLTAPYRLRAVGFVGGREVILHSYADTADVGNTINITPFTDLIVANAAGIIASNYFDSQTVTALSADELAAQETALQEKLVNVFAALGVDTAIDLMRTSFNVDHTLLDAALDMVRIETSPDDETIVLITNLIDGETIQDNVTVSDDNTEVLVVHSDLSTAQSDYVAIANQANALSNLFASGFPTVAQLAPLFSDDFYYEDASKAIFLSEISQDPTFIGTKFEHLSYFDYFVDVEADTTTVTISMYLTVNGETEPWPLIWKMAKNAGGVWLFRGDQKAADVWFNFVCALQTAYNNMKGCGIHIGVTDNDITNNPGDEAIQSAKMSLIDVEGNPVPDVAIYLRDPEASGAGRLNVYNYDSVDGVFYSGDYVGFGDGSGNTISPTLFAAGVRVRIDLYSTDLDMSDPAAPVAIGTPIETIYDDVTAAPVSNGNSASYPDIGSTNLAAFNNWVSGNLDVTYTALAAPLKWRVEAWLSVSDNAGGYIQVDRYNPGVTTTLNLDTSILDQTVTDAHKELRLYAMDKYGQHYITTYTGAIDLTTGTGTGTVSIPHSEVSLASQISGTWYMTEFDDGVRQDDTVDDYAEEVNGLATITINGDGSWTFETPADGSYTYLASLVTVNEAELSVTLMDYDGLGRTILTYDPYSNSINGQWQKLADDGITFYENYETWLMEGPPPAEVPPPSLSCATESGWDAAADGGAGAPITPYSFADFELVIADCGTAIQFSSSDIAGKTVNFAGGATATFNADGTGTYNDPDPYTMTWLIERSTAGHDYLVMDATGGDTFRSTSAIIGLSDIPPTTGTVFTFVDYYEQNNFSDMDRAVGTDGEIWNSTFVQQ